jgi:Ni/Fe-hydrogenase subunit HybB-like protein
MFSVGMVAVEILGYIVLVRWLPVLPKVEAVAQ